MLDVLKYWYKRYFTDPQATVLFCLLIFGLFVVTYLGDMIAPLLASIVIAYVLDWLANVLCAMRIPRRIASLVVFSGFLGLLVITVFGLIPVLVQQTISLANQLPGILKKWQDLLHQLPERFPDVITDQQIINVLETVQQFITSSSQTLFLTTLSSIPGFIALTVYLVIVPLMVFFFLYDRDSILNWAKAFLPKERSLLLTVWQTVNRQLGNYVRGKVAEMLIVGIGTFVALSWMSLNYSLLLSVAVGVSVLIPYVGAFLVTIPVAAVALIQFGFSAEFIKVIVLYLIIQVIDGNILVPLLFSEAVSIHPVGIIVSILVFGGFWGLWGIFFAIPLAILVQAIIKTWPRTEVTKPFNN